MIMTTKNGNWKIGGVCLADSDSMYKTIKTAIETGIGLDQKSLQKSTGHCAPIRVDKSTKTIQFFRS